MRRNFQFSLKEKIGGQTSNRTSSSKTFGVFSDLKNSTDNCINSLSHYVAETRRYPILGQQEETDLAKLWRKHRDREAAHKLVTSHLRLVVRMAMKFKNSGLPIEDIISEGNIGLLTAVERFDPEKGFRLSTYAMWWIQSRIHNYVLRSWSLVKIGTTIHQKKLFYNLRKIKSDIQAYDEINLNPDDIEYIADKLCVSEDDVISMNQRLGRDSSLNIQVNNDPDRCEWQDLLVNEEYSQEDRLAAAQELDNRRQLLANALKMLDQREIRIFVSRQLSENKLTLKELSKEFGVSLERIRQIEIRAFEKIQKSILETETTSKNGNMT